MLGEGGHGRKLHVRTAGCRNDLCLVERDEKEKEKSRPNANPLVQHEEGKVDAPTLNPHHGTYTAKSYNTPVKMAIGPVRPIRIIG